MTKVVYDVFVNTFIKSADSSSPFRCALLL